MDDIRSRFRKVDGTKIPDVIKYIEEHMAKYPEDSFDIFIGSDSQLHKKYVIYVTAIVIHRKGKGAHVIIHKEKEPAIKDFFTRMWKEAEKSVEVSKFIKDNLLFDAMKIDFDFSILPEFRSSKITDSAVGYAKGMGFSDSEIRVKPVAFAASYASDRFCR